MDKSYNENIVTNTLNRCLNYLYQHRVVKVMDVFPFVDYPKYSELCKTGCVNYGKKWSCPPFAPIYNDYTKKYKYLSICVLSINLAQFSYIRNDYLKIKAANIILKSRIDKTLRFLLNGDRYYISTGSCRLCKPCKCKVNEKCARRDIMSYSFEALGVDVGSMTLELFDHKLLWYKKDDLPEYTTVVAGLLSKDTIDDKIIANTLRDFS